MSMVLSGRWARLDCRIRAVFPRAADHYGMDGDGAKAEELLRQAEHELHDAVESAKAAK
ncbi:MAG: hypothetical protein P4L83_10220 [Nevskia sp.]|nr:hypothetical protein [Nevskia sp.]